MGQRCDVSCLTFFVKCGSKIIQKTLYFSLLLEKTKAYKHVFSHYFRVIGFSFYTLFEAHICILHHLAFLFSAQPAVSHPLIICFF